MHRLAIYPGTFDPLTLGHMDVARRAARIFERVILAVSAAPRKGTMFSIEERLAMAGRVSENIPNVEADRFEGLLVDYARARGCNVIVRGIRAFSDFEYEFQMALTNRKLAPDVETLFLMPQEMYSVLSSSVVREIASLGGDTRDLVPSFVQVELDRKLGRATGKVRR